MSILYTLPLCIARSYCYISDIQLRGSMSEKDTRHIYLRIARMVPSIRGTNFTQCNLDSAHCTEGTSLHYSKFPFNTNCISLPLVLDLVCIEGTQNQINTPHKCQGRLHTIILVDMYLPSTLDTSLLSKQNPLHITGTDRKSCMLHTCSDSLNTC